MATVVKEDADSDDEDETSLAVGLLASARDTKVVASLPLLFFLSFPATSVGSAFQSPPGCVDVETETWRGTPALTWSRASFAALSCQAWFGGCARTMFGIDVRSLAAFRMCIGLVMGLDTSKHALPRRLSGL